MSVNPKCLHCRIRDQISQWSQEHGPRGPNGETGLDVATITEKACEAIVEVIACLPDAATRHRAMKHAHNALDAALRAEMTGKRQHITIPGKDEK